MHLEGGYLKFPLFCGILVSCFFKRALRKETSINCVNYLNNSYLFVTICAFYFNDYDIHVNAVFKEANYGFTVKSKKYLYSSAVNVKRIVTRLALFQLSEGQSPTVEPRQCDHRWAIKS